MPDSWAKALRPTNGLVGLDHEAGQVALQPAGRHDLLGDDARRVAAHPPPTGWPSAITTSSSGDVAGTLAEAVDGRLDLAGARLDRR